MADNNDSNKSTGESANNKETISRFYSAFTKRDADTMASCYHADVHFSDPVFPDLHGEHAGNMWKMLCERAKDLLIEPSGIEADENSGRGHWDATYTFSATGRKVHNQIDAEFEFKDGLIIRHVDHFNLWKWTRMALGPVGVILGWSPIVKGKVRGQAAAGLAAWEKKNS